MSERLPVPESVKNKQTTVELSVSARKLSDVDVTSKTDPICILSTKVDEGNWREIGRTEAIMNNLNPEFITKFNLTYIYEQTKWLKFELFDVDIKKEKLQIGDFLGEFECTLGQLVSCLRKEAPLSDRKKSKKSKGQIIIVAELEECGTREEISILLEASDLDLKKTLGKINPYLRISKENDDRSYTVVHRTETRKKESNPKWELVTLSKRALCNGDQERALRIECFDDRNGDDKFIGELTTSLRELIVAKVPHDFNLINEKKKDKKEDYESSGKITLVKAHTEIQHTFADYIDGGTKIQLTIAVDFTKSNGNPDQPTSLHYFSPAGPANQYARAIESVGQILQQHGRADGSQMNIQAFGFGAKDKTSEAVADKFPLNGDKDSPGCKGVKEVLKAYYDTLQDVQLDGPSNFSPVISHVARLAQKKPNGQEYHILLILTDGGVDDMAKTKKEIVEATECPMSIIIVGIGNGDFTAMKMLDADDKPITCCGRKQAARDIVQFVEFREFDIRSTGSSQVGNEQCLANEVLRELPDQFMSYMRTNENVHNESVFWFRYTAVKTN